MRPVLAITMGDVNGMGPEILTKVLADDSVWEICRPFVIGSAEVLQQVCACAAPIPPPRTIRDVSQAVWDGAATWVIDADQSRPWTTDGAHPLSNGHMLMAVTLLETLGGRL